jgi:hypothetical protein
MQDLSRPVYIEDMMESFPALVKNGDATNDLAEKVEFIIREVSTLREENKQLRAMLEKILWPQATI